MQEINEICDGDAEARQVSLQSCPVYVFVYVCVQLPSSTDQRADAYCIVYSVSDRDSFLYARELLSDIKKKNLQRGAVQILVANKADLVRQRQVSEDGKGPDQCSHIGGSSETD